MSTATLDDAPPTGGNMIHLAEILQRSTRLRQRRFEMLPLRGPGSAFTEPQGRKPGDLTAPEELSDLISSMSVVGLLEPVLAEEITVASRAPTIRLVTGERRLRAMRWGAVNLPDNPHFGALAAVVCPGPLSDEERHMWRFIENFAREPLRPGEQAAALMYQRCAVLVGKLLRAGRPVPAEVYSIADSIERFKALERIRANDQSCAAPWSEVLSRLGLQLSERKATELVRAFRELPRELTEEMDEQEIRLNTRIRFAQLRRGRADAASEIWAALKGSGRLHLLPSAVDIGLGDPGLDAEQVIESAEERQEQANAGRRAKLSRVPDPAPGSEQEEPEAEAITCEDDSPPGYTPVVLDDHRHQVTGAIAEQAQPVEVPDAPPADARAVRTALDGLRSLLAELRAGRQLGRYDRGSVLLAVRELDQALTHEPAVATDESENAA
ncbi:ParB N-terminal domain-containing protein [Kitasatospora sp. NBC_00240]|uniref:ParB N-terminal domain-containing protein n=1 Tax=Kitasatospora sp. NBC_00240 TaxID=2903567 RepID=UPI002257337C|nr:ParB N-terminal domain-containing protein [Kitasatospora sp. NBC_00240]MCX5216203.1 ParB N-terminal domain-containing protein [Kitasatospora sp. NBC_00240]